ncbi:MAG: methyltransferase domain-containing protein [Sarcina sp.]
MNCFNNRETVEKFLKGHKNYDGRIALILRSYLKKGASVLNIGLNNGKDFEVLKQTYDTVAIDGSEFFIDIYKENNKGSEVYQLNDIKLDISKKFDCIFSNKLINHFTVDELTESLKNQANLLEAGGKAFHFYCDGEGEILLGGVTLNMYDEKILREVVPSEFEIVKFSKYLLDNRFSYVLLKKI